MIVDHMQEVDDVDHNKMQTDCSRGIHHLVLNEQIGRVCKYCSHVSEEIRHILPDFVSYILVFVLTFEC